MNLRDKGQWSGLKDCARRAFRSLLTWSGSRKSNAERGYLLTEALVYIGVVFVIGSIGYVALYKCIDHCVVLRRNAEDIVRAVHAGERWRADVRTAGPRAQLEGSGSDQILHLQGPNRFVDYRFAEGVVYRRSGSEEWVRVLDRVKACAFHAEPRQNLSAWRWELELEPQIKGVLKPGRVRPLFTFLAVPQASAKP